MFVRETGLDSDFARRFFESPESIVTSRYILITTRSQTPEIAFAKFRDTIASHCAVKAAKIGFAIYVPKLKKFLFFIEERAAIDVFQCTQYFATLSTQAALDCSSTILEFDRFLTDELRRRNIKLYTSLKETLESVYKKDQTRLTTALSINMKLVPSHDDLNSQ